MARDRPERAAARHDPKQRWVSNAFPVDLLTPEDSLAWLLTAAGNPDDINERLAAYALVSRLDGLPLALTMATSS